MAVSGISLDEKDLYYQWLINNNSTSTMLNALSGNTNDDSSSLSILSSLANTVSSGTLDLTGIDSLTGISSLGNAGSLTGIGGTESVSSFAKILESYLNQNSSGVSAASSVTDAATMAEKLSGVLEEAAKTEDTSSLTYKTVKEIYEYFSAQVSGKAQSLLGNTTTATASSEKTETDETSTGNAIDRYYDEMDEAAIRGEEFDFSVYDEIVENSFGIPMPMTPVS